MYSGLLQGAISTVKRKVDGAANRSRVVNDALRELLRASGLPMASASSAEICRVAVPAGTIEPSAEVAFRRLIHLALLKLDFLDRGSRPTSDGPPLIDVVARLGEDADQLDEGDALDPGDDEEDDDAEQSEADVGQIHSRAYWAGGIAWGTESKLDDFLANGYWQLGWPRAATTAPALVAWRRFDKIKPGDWFAIKGYGGRNQLHIHFLGEVTAIDPQLGRLELRRLDIPLYKGQAPGGAGAGSFHDALVPVTRDDVVHLLFGPGAQATSTPPTSRPSIPLNLIFYGPPGTGKTYHLVTKLFPLFTRGARQIRELDRTTEVASDLTWFECIALALHQLGGKAKVADLVAHPILKAKHALVPHATPREIVWGTLGQHTVESSTTVKMKRRLGDLIFAAVTLMPAEFEALTRFNDEHGQKFFSVGYRSVTFRQFVGYLQVGSLGIEVLPKADRKATEQETPWRNLLHEMLKVGLGVDLLGSEAARQSLTRPSLIELVVANFIPKVERIVREGMARGYREEETNGTTFRGRLLATQHLRANHSRKDRCFVRYSVYDRDTNVNRLLRAGLDVAAQAPVSASLQARAVSGLLHFESVRRVVPKPELFERLRLTRSTERYREALLLSKMLLEGLSPALRAGKVAVFAFLFDMNLLWERYIGVLFQRSSRGRVRVVLQKSGTFLVQLDQTRRTIQPDILLLNPRSAEPIAVLDTKWKLADPRGADEGHLKQMFAYNEIFGAPHAILVQPGTGTRGIGSSGMFWQRAHGCDVLELGLEQEGGGRTAVISAQITTLIDRLVGARLETT